MVDPIKDQGVDKLLLFVPGGKVPPRNYLPMIKETQEKSSLRLSAAIIQCHINLCDPIFEIHGLMVDAIARSNKTGLLMVSDIFVAGHSLGGVGARHFFDGFEGSAGLALFGTQTNGDHEDYKGTLGYPADLAAFPRPILALTGELDSMPISHAADLVRQAKALDEKEKLKKLPIIVPGMDHSQFCPPFEVTGDIKPEISNDNATGTIGAIVAAWLDNAVLGDAAVESAPFLKEWIAKTEPIVAPFIGAVEVDRTWCATAQRLLAGSPEHLNVDVEERFGSAALEHCHPKASMEGHELRSTVCAYRFCGYLNSTIPVVWPEYEGADDISCKMSSEDVVASKLELPPPDMDSGEVQNKCSFLNQQALEKAKELVNASWPLAFRRFEAQGKRISFAEDSHAFMGPQWVLEGLSVKETEDEITIQSAALISPLTSSIFPGSHYCKLLAPSKAVEIVMTTALTQRYFGATGTKPLVIV